MSTWRAASFLTLAALSLIAAAAAFRPQPALPTAPPPVYPLLACTTAAACLDRAIAACGPEQLPEFQATLWQRVQAAPLCFEAEGTVLAGQGQRFRLDLNITSAGASRWLRIVSDGQALWETEDSAQGQHVARVDLRELLGPGIPPRQSAAQLRQLCNFPGPDRLLRELRQRVIFIAAARVPWRERAAWLLTGARIPASTAPCPDYQARQCRLVLDAETYWPHRLEWWGPAPKSRGDVCLLELELRDPVLPGALPERAFAFDPQDAVVEDRTPAWKEKLRARVIERRTYPGN